MIVVLFSAFLILGVVGTIIASMKESDDFVRWTWFLFGLVGGIGIVVCIIAGVSLAGDTAELEAFYNGNIGAYQKNVTDTQVILTITQNTENATIPIQGSIEKIGVGGFTAERMKELRDAITHYNAKLAYYRMIKKNIWLSVLFPEIPDGLKYVVVQ